MGYRFLLLVVLVGCTAPTAWRPGPGYIGVDVYCATASTWRFAVDGADQGAWDAVPPDARGQFVTAGVQDHTFLAWELQPQNVATIFVGVKDGDAVKVRCGL